MFSALFIELRQTGKGSECSVTNNYGELTPQVLVKKLIGDWFVTRAQPALTWRRSNVFANVFIVNFERISHIDLVFSLWTLNK